MSRSITAGDPRRALEFRCAESTDSASQLQARLQEAPGEQFPHDHDTVEPSAGQAADNDVPEGTSPNTKAEGDTPRAQR